MIPNPVSGNPSKKWIKRACLIGASILLLVVAARLLRSRYTFDPNLADFVLIGSVKESRIGEPSDKVDAYVTDGHTDQNYFVSFNKLEVVRGNFSGQIFGVRLHSPAETFNIRNEHPVGRRYRMFFRYAPTTDGRRVLVLMGFVEL